ncbi:hypothetical protein [Tepidibacillus marianensis]|uniref:hypothetical protein n=1 Tax=Tepidibacillus marianensis TaxID=3131995 RepID=UPI0030CD837B
MRIQEIIKRIENFEGNLIRRNGAIYISPANMDKFVAYLETCEEIETLLITPYLINLKDEALYELHYYEFEIEVVSNGSESSYVEHAKHNALPEEIIRNIKPKAMTAKKDKQFFLSALHDYLKAMKGMTFEYDRKSDKSLWNAELFYQIF